MERHPNRDQFLQRLRQVAPEVAAPFRGDVYRFVDPQFINMNHQFEGRGATKHNGRWHLQGDQLIVYGSSHPETALKESLAASRYYGFPDRRKTPMVLVSAHAKLDRVIDLRDGKTRQRLKLSQDHIVHTDWRHDNMKGSEAITQAWGWAFYECGVEGILCSSSADADHTNLIAFPYNFSAGTQIKPAQEVIWPRA